jgi:hypothetical protein
MTTMTAPASARSERARRIPLPTSARLLWLELRRSPMLWALPVLGVLFYMAAYRPAMSDPPLWNVRAVMLQAPTVLTFAPVLAGVSAWAGSREGRRGIADLLNVTGLPRWAGRLAGWAAVTFWAEAAYLAGVAVVYGITARQAAWGGPLWWPVAVGAATAAAACAVGFTAGALLPSRFTAPLAAVVVFLALGAGAIAMQNSHPATYAQIWPLNVQGAFPYDSFGIFYHELPDLAIAQLMFAGGLGAAALGALGLPAAAGGKWLRAAAAVVIIAGLASAGTAVGLAGTAKLQTNGIVIPTLHDAASDRPVPYSPVCSHSVIPVCLQPAFRAYLPDVTVTLAPLLNELAGLPGAPVKVTQVAVTSMKPDPDNGITFDGPVISGHPAVLYLPLSGISLPGEGVTTAGFTSSLAETLFSIPITFVGLPPGGLPGTSAGAPPSQAAQVAVAQALAQKIGALQPAATGPGVGQCQSTAPCSSAGGARTGNLPPSAQAQAAAAKRFLALPAAARHAWLLTHLTALRAGQISLSEIP